MRLSRLAEASVFCAAWAFVVVYIWIVFRRISFPFELEWIEGGMVDQVQRIVHGQGIYVQPGIRFVPFLYTPLYFYLSAGASVIFGGGLFPLRLVSFLASLVSFSVIFLIVRDETDDWRTGMLSAGFFAATFRLAGAWMDIARVDSLFVALWLLFIYVVKGRQSLYLAVLAGLLAAMAFLTKQLAIVLCLPVFAWLFWRNWKHAFTALAVASGMVYLSTLLFDRSSDGWYSFYIFKLLFGQAEWQPSQLAVFLGNDLIYHLPVAIIFILSFFIFPSPRGKSESPISFYLVVLLSALAGAFTARMKVGGYDNVLLPAYAAMVICQGLAMNKLVRLADRLPRGFKDRCHVMLYLACLIQLGLMGYNPYHQIPTRADLQAGYRLLNKISQVEGEVYLPDHGYLSSLAGKNSYAHHSTIWDVVRADQNTLAREMLIQDLDNAIRQQRFSMIILDSDWNHCCRLIDAYYLQAGEVFLEEGVFYPVTGWARRPSMIFVPKRLQ